MTALLAFAPAVEWYADNDIVGCKELAVMESSEREFSMGDPVVEFVSRKAAADAARFGTDLAACLKGG